MDEKKQGSESGPVKPDVLAPDPPEITRTEVARLLGVSVFKVRTMERLGELRPRMAPDGTRYFALVEIKAVAQALTAPKPADPPLPSPRGRPVDPRTDGEIAAEVFRLLEEGKTLIEIVQEAGVVPKRVRELFTEWSITLEAGENERRRQVRAVAAEREAQRLDRENKEHTKRMTEMDREIAKQLANETGAAEPEASRTRAARRRDRVLPDPPPPPPSGPLPETSVSPGFEALIDLALNKLKGV